MKSCDLSYPERSIIIATNAHHGQTDKAGMDYILHPLRIMVQLNTDAERIVAVLHDVVENTATTFDDWLMSLRETSSNGWAEFRDAGC